MYLPWHRHRTSCECNLRKTLSSSGGNAKSKQRRRVEDKPRDPWTTFAPKEATKVSNSDAWILVRFFRVSLQENGVDARRSLDRELFLRDPNG